MKVVAFKIIKNDSRQCYQWLHPTGHRTRENWKVLGGESTQYKKMETRNGPTNPDDPFWVPWRIKQLLEDIESSGLPITKIDLKYLTGHDENNFYGLPRVEKDKNKRVKFSHKILDLKRIFGTSAASYRDYLFTHGVTPSAVTESLVLKEEKLKIGPDKKDDISTELKSLNIKEEPKSGITETGKTGGRKTPTPATLSTPPRHLTPTRLTPTRPSSAFIPLPSSPLPFNSGDMSVNSEITTSTPLTQRSTTDPLNQELPGQLYNPNVFKVMHGVNGRYMNGYHVHHLEMDKKGKT